MNISFRPSAIITWFLSCAFLGAMVFSFIAPKSIGWYFEPPVDIGINCRPAADWAMSTLLKGQLIGMGIGIVLGGLLIFLIMKRDKKSNPLK